MKKLVFATGNADKARELREIFPEYEILTLKDINFKGEIEENGESFEENALIKAKAAYEESGMWAIADDSGLCVDALGGGPGIYSARYSGGDYLDNCLKLMEEMKDVPKEERGAHFACAAALYGMKNGEVVKKVFVVRVKGEIAFEMTGEGGFGYDPLFIEEKTGKTYAEMSEEEKNSLSHRKLAFEGLKKWVDEMTE